MRNNIRQDNNKSHADCNDPTVRNLPADTQEIPGIVKKPDWKTHKPAVKPQEPPTPHGVPNVNSSVPFGRFAAHMQHYPARQIALSGNW